MKTRVRKKYSYLVESHQKLLENNNFWNSQNYVLGNYLEAKVYDKYVEKNFLKKYKYNILTVALFLGIVFLNTGEDSKSITLVLLGIFSMFFPVVFYFFYENYNKFLRYYKYYLKKEKFYGKKFIFRKYIEKEINRGDYIILNK